MVSRRASHAWSLAAWALFALTAALASAGDSAERFRHGAWPFQPPERPAVPATHNRDWAANPIDAFVLKRLEDAGLGPSPRAEKLALLRRVTFDLTGLFPTPAEQAAFLADSSPEAYGRVVDRLLDSPQYGERWAQHWLDLVRYAETDGFKEDALRPNAHKYRDYVVRSLNADLPYDRFISQQLAGDELEPDNPDALIATGLNRLPPDETNAADMRQRRQEILDDITETTGLALLGLTIGCAQCHDHKFDPILQSDYYRFQAFFVSTLPRDDAPLATGEQQRDNAEKHAAWEAATRPIRDEMDALLAAERDKCFREGVEKFDGDTQQALLAAPPDRSALQKQLALQAMRYVQPKMNEAATHLKGDQKQRYEALQGQLAEFDALKPPPLATVMAVCDAGRQAPPTFRLAGGDFKKRLEEVQPGFPLFLDPNEPEPPAAAVPVESTGRRAALARWLTRADHPLTARVMMNRLWQHHFGEGIVATASDFGVMGAPPTHPELLDWLAAEFVERGWSLKAMHRLMVTSAAYCQSSESESNPLCSQARKVDGGNRWLWHARRRRLEGEAIRDAMLEVSGQLNPRMFGPSARPQLPAGISTNAYQPDPRPEDRNRRSVYLFAKRNLRYPLFEAFDLPDMHNSCPRRTTTTTVPQALLLLNSEFTLEQARHWAGQLLACHGADDAALVSGTLVQAYARQPSGEELAAAQQFLTAQSAAITTAGEPANDALPLPLPAGVSPARAAAVLDFCHALLNSNEFLYVD